MGEERPERFESAAEAARETVRSLAQVTAALPRGEARPGQADMAEAAARAIEDGRHLVVQAGTGKSLASLVPAVPAATGRTPRC